MFVSSEMPSKHIPLPRIRRTPNILSSIGQAGLPIPSNSLNHFFSLVIFRISANTGKGTLKRLRKSLPALVAGSSQCLCKSNFAQLDSPYFGLTLAILLQGMALESVLLSKRSKPRWHHCGAIWPHLVHRRNMRTYSVDDPSTKYIF